MFTKGDTSKPVTTDEESETVEKLITAAASGHIEAVLQLLDAGANIHADDDAALHHATWSGHFETVKLLLEWKASIDAPDENGSTPLCNAAWAGHTQIVELLLDNGATINGWDSEGPESALRQASRCCHTETVKLPMNKQLPHPKRQTFMNS